MPSCVPASVQTSFVLSCDDDFMTWPENVEPILDVPKFVQIIITKLTPFCYSLTDCVPITFYNHVDNSLHEHRSCHVLDGCQLSGRKGALNILQIFIKRIKLINIHLQITGFPRALVEFFTSSFCHEQLKVAENGLAKRTTKHTHSKSVGWHFPFASEV